MQTLFSIAVIIATICLTSMAAMALEPLTATIRVSNGSLYDYVIIGEHPKATDGFDNAYDTISPGNLNADMGQPFISVIIPHPEWKPAMREMRGDIRSLAKRQQWDLYITSSLPAGTPVNVAFRKVESTLPPGVKLLLKEDAAKAEYNLGAHSYMIEAPGPGSIKKLLIIVEQP